MMLWCLWSAVLSPGSKKQYKVTVWYVFFWKEQLITYVLEQLWTWEWYSQYQNDLSLFIMYFDFSKTPVCSQFPARGIYSWFITILLNFFLIYHDLTAFSEFVCSCLVWLTTLSSSPYLYLFALSLMSHLLVLYSLWKSQQLASL